MKITFLVTLVFGLLFVTALGAAEKNLTPQQQRMTLCNQQATAQTLSGDARKHYMSDCVKNTKTEPGQKSLTPQQQRMRECNAQATQQSLKGDDRSKFMSACLKKQG
ncbi:psiF repeat-containing protein [Enterobacter sp. AG5470]|nr:psiF repeat-containing protein [Enterobacter sp. AG5470]